MAIPKPNAAVLEARERRNSRASSVEARIDWYINEVLSKTDMAVLGRMKLAVEFAKSQMVKNIGIPVIRDATGTVLVRSKPGEFPRADTTLLMKSVFTDIKSSSNHVVDGYIGTPVMYGVTLELYRQRRWMVRTLIEEKPRITKILLAGIKQQLIK